MKCKNKYIFIIFGFIINMKKRIFPIRYAFFKQYWYSYWFQFTEVMRLKWNYQMKMEPIKSCPTGKVQEVLCEGNSWWKNTKSEVRILSFATSGILKFTKFQISVLFAKSLFQKWENYFSREIWSIILNIVKMKIILKRISI